MRLQLVSQSDKNEILTPHPNLLLVWRGEGVRQRRSPTLGHQAAIARRCVPPLPAKRGEERGEGL